MSRMKLRLATALSALVLGIAALLATRLTPLRAEPSPAQQAPLPEPGEGRILHKVEPVYPPEARLAGIEGEVELEIAINERGLVTDARVLSGPDELRAAAVKAVLEWQFTPGQPAKATVVTTFRLHSKETPRELPATLGIVRIVDLSALSSTVKERIAARLAVKPGEPFTLDTWRAAADLVGSIDADLRVAFDATSGVLRVVPGYRAGDPGEFPRVPQTVRIPSNVQQAKLRRQTPPVYPEAAKASGLQGLVRLEATIGKDGRIASLRLLRGDPMLANAAIEAVARWEYEPTWVNGVPVAVITEIDVNFH